MGKKKDIVPRTDKIPIKTGDKEIFIDRSELLGIGCRNCVHKLNHQCFHGLIGDEFRDEGYCPELVDWLFRITSGATTRSQVWELYHLWVGNMQTHEEYGTFRRIEEEITLLESQGGLSKEDRERLEMKKTAAKIWWSRINDQVMKYLSKVNDRDSRKDNVDTMTQAVSLGQLHKVMRVAKDD